MIYHYPSIFLRIFSYHICVIYCWHVSFHYLDQRSLIPKIVLGCVRNFSVAGIQTGLNYLIPPQLCGSWWWGFWLGVCTCSHQLIDFIDIKSPSSYSVKYSFVDCWLVCFIFIGLVLILKTVSGLYPNRTYVFASPHMFVEGCSQGASFCGFTCHHQYIDWIQGISSIYSSLNLCRQV